MTAATLTRLLTRLAVGAAGVLVGMALAWNAAAQDEKAPAIKKSLPKVDDDAPPPVTPKGEPKRAARPAEGEPPGLAAEAEAAGHPAVKELFRKLAVPYDELAPDKGGPKRIEPYPEQRPEWTGETVTVVPLNLNGKPLPSEELKIEAVKRVTPYEDIVLREAQAFLKKRPEEYAPKMGRDEQLVAAEKALAAGARFHKAAVDGKTRRGNGWARVGAPLDRVLKTVRRELLLSYMAKKEWAKAGDLALSLGAEYPDDPDITREIYLLELERLDAGTADGKDESFLALREGLRQYQRANAAAGDDQRTAVVGAKLKAKAAALANEAKALADSKPADALLKLNFAESLDPDLADLGQLRSRLKLRYPILYVGMTELPERVSPTTARTDADRRAVELVFESLIDAVPDAKLGRRFRPNLASRLPLATPLTRELELRPGTQWADPAYGELTANDVRGSLELYGHVATRPQARRLGLLAGVQGVSRPLELKFGLKQGHGDTLGLLDFKVMPAAKMLREQVRGDDLGFSQKPVGSGPFAYAGRETDGSGREFAVFKRNPLYGRRADRLGLPYLSEVRFFKVTATDPSADFRERRMHLYADVPTAQLGTLESAQAGIQAVTRTLTIRPTRSIHVLAVNHRRPIVQSAEMRRGLSLAIDREAVLNDQYRSQRPDAHRALNGPFPPETWACPTNQPPLVNADLGRSLMVDAAAKANTRARLTLVHPTNDPQAGPACFQIKAQVEAAAGSAGDGKSAVQIDVEGLDDAAYAKRVEQQRDFDLAYVRLDYADDLFCLADWFDPEAAGLLGRNLTGYLAEGTGKGDADERFAKLLLEQAQHRDLSGSLVPLTAEIARQFNERTPFIPLWQLDRHLVVHQDLDFNGQNPALIDPVTLFQGAQGWKLK